MKHIKMHLRACLVRTTTTVRSLGEPSGCGSNPTAECGAADALLTHFYAEPTGMLHGAGLWNVANTLEALTNYLILLSTDNPHPAILERIRSAALRLAGVGTNLLTDYNDDLLW